MRSSVIKIFLVIASLLITFLLVEFMFRLLKICPKNNYIQRITRISDNPKLMYELIPSAPGINSDGMYDDKDYNIVKPKDVIRIAVLGDSIAFGSGVPYGKAFPYILENKLNEYLGSNNLDFHYEVLNFAVPGYNMIQYIEQLKVKASKYKPDIIILSYCINDGDPVPHVIPLFLNIKDLGKDPHGIFVLLWSSRLTKFLIQESDLFRFILQRIYLIKTKEDFMVDNNQLKLINIVNGFSELKKYADSNSAEVIVLFNPYLDYDKNNYSDENMAMLKKLPHEKGFTFVNMLDSYRHIFKSAAELWIKGSVHPITLSQDTCHPNEKGHEIICDELLKVIISLRGTVASVHREANETLASAVFY